jgi:hypothetical protein
MLVAGAVAPAPAGAQAGDPAEGSPSGVIYEIPLDNARLDAAPGRQSRPGGGSAGGLTSPIRSENGFGSSAAVPGAVASGGTGKGSAGGKRSRKAGRTATPAAPVTTPAEGSTGIRTAAIGPSESRAYVLLALALAVAAGIGLAGRYVARRR